MRDRVASGPAGRTQASRDGSSALPGGGHGAAKDLQHPERRDEHVHEHRQVDDEDRADPSPRSGTGGHAQEEHLGREARRAGADDVEKDAAQLCRSDVSEAEVHLDGEHCCARSEAQDDALPAHNGLIGHSAPDLEGDSPHQPNGRGDPAVQRAQGCPPPGRLRSWQAEV